MTSRTIDIHCETCRKYMFSLHPRATSEELTKLNYCSVKCEQDKQTIPTKVMKSHPYDMWIDIG